MQFCQDLLDLAVREGQDKVSPAAGSGRLRVFSGLTVTAIDHGSKDDSYAYTHLQGGLKIRSKFVIVATGYAIQMHDIRLLTIVAYTHRGLFVEPTIGGILKPCWSYLVGIKDPLCSSDDVVPVSTSLDAYNSSKFLGRAHSLNVLTWGFTHDWCLTHGYMRVIERSSRIIP